MKKNILKIILFCLTAVFSATVASADVVELENGSIIFGTIERFDKSTLQVKTDYAGLLSISLNKVISFSSDTPLYVSFANRERVFGKVTWSKAQMLVEKPDGSTLVSPKPPEVAWREGHPDPFKRHWNFEAGFDVSGKTGNTERISVGGKARAMLQGPDDRLLLYLRYAYAKDDGVNSDNSVIGGVDFERYFAKRHSLYARTELEHDRIKGLDFRATAAAGYGYYFLKEKHHTLRSRAGLMVRYDSWREDPSDSTVGLDFGLSHMYQFANTWKLQNEVVYTPSVEALDDYHLYHESSLLIPVAGSEIWKFQFGVSNDYSSPPAENKEYLDTTYFMRLVLNWP